MPAQPPGVGVANVVDPAPNAGIEFREADETVLPIVKKSRESTGGLDRFAGLQRTGRGSAAA